MMRKEFPNRQRMEEEEDPQDKRALAGDLRARKLMRRKW